MSYKSTEKKEDKKLAEDTKKVKDVDKKVKSKTKKDSAKNANKKSIHPIKSAKKLINELMSEIKKISWPTAKDTTKNALITLGAILVVGLFIWILDFGLSTIRDVAFDKIPEWSIFSDKDNVSDSDNVSSNIIVTNGDSAN